MATWGTVSAPLAALIVAYGTPLPQPAVPAGERVAQVQSRLKEQATTMQITSPSFGHGQEIPVRHTCEGQDLSPPLQWQGVPPEAKSLALIVDDPDAPDPAAPKMTYVHWVLYNLPPTSTGLAEGVAASHLPPGTQEGINDWHRPGYGGPCPPIGNHRYFFKLYALDTVLTGLHHPTKADLEKAMAHHVLAQATLMGTYIKEANR